MKAFGILLLILISQPALAFKCYPSESEFRVNPKFWVKQYTESACSLAVSTMLINEMLSAIKWGSPISQSILKSDYIGTLWSGAIQESGDGLVLDQFGAELTKLLLNFDAGYAARVMRLDNFSITELGGRAFAKTLAELMQDRKVFIIGNILSGEEGHYVLLDSIDSKAVRIIDPDPDTPMTYSMGTADLLRSLRTTDESNGKERGLIIIEKVVL